METLIEKKCEILKMMGYEVRDFDGPGFRYYRPEWLGEDKEYPPYWDWMSVKEYNIEDSWELLMEVVAVINTHHKMNLRMRDLMYTMEYLLSGGYKFGSEEPLHVLTLTKENLFERCAMYAKHHNQIFTDIKECVK